MAVHTSADHDPELAALLGQFSQACNYLERQIEFILTRLLPITTDMGHVLFSGNQMRRNIEILVALTTLPEVPIQDATRTKLAELAPRLRAINDDRSRFLHNQIIGGMFGEPLYLALHKQDGGSAMLSISKDLIKENINEAKALWSALYIAPVEYDLSQWGMAFPSYRVKEYPNAPQPTSPRPKGQKRKDQQKSEDGKTTPKSDTEPQK
jgi:hypothetical protein